MRLQFIAETDHEVTGELSWKDSRVARNSPYGPLIGMGLAHDSLEHFSLTTVSDEIMAHAAMYWGRYRAGYCNKYGRGLTLEDIGAEWANLVRAIFEFHLSSPPRTCKLDDEIEEDISTIIAAGRKSVREEIGQEYNSPRWQDYADEIEKAFRGWFRIGFRKAEAKFRKMGIDPAQFSYLYEQLGNRFEKLVPQYEGQKIVLTLNKDGFRLLEIQEEVY